MFFDKTKRELKLLTAFQKVFFDEHKKLKSEAKTILAFLRNEACARGELGQNGRPYFYDDHNRFDVHAAAFLLGKRRMFDLVIKYLALDERDVFRLLEQDKQRDEEIKRELDI